MLFSYYLKIGINNEVRNKGQSWYLQVCCIKQVMILVADSLLLDDWIFHFIVFVCPIIIIIIII